MIGQPKTMQPMQHSLAWLSSAHAGLTNQLLYTTKKNLAIGTALLCCQKAPLILSTTGKDKLMQREPSLPDRSTRMVDRRRSHAMQQIHIKPINRATSCRPRARSLNLSFIHKVVQKQSVPHIKTSFALLINELESQGFYYPRYGFRRAHSSSGVDTSLVCGSCSNNSRCWYSIGLTQRHLYP